MSEFVSPRKAKELAEAAARAAEELAQEQRLKMWVADFTEAMDYVDEGLVEREMAFRALRVAREHGVPVAGLLDGEIAAAAKETV